MIMLRRYNMTAPVGNLLLQFYPPCALPRAGSHSMFHTHIYYELTCVFNGSVELATESGSVCHGAGTVFCVPPGLPHMRLSTSRSPQFFARSLRFTYSQLPKGDDVFSCFDSLLREGLAPIAASDSLKRCFALVDDEFCTVHPFSELRLCALLSGLVLTLLDDYGVADSGQEPKPVAGVISDYISENLVSGVTLAGVAQRIGMSERQTQRVIADCFGSGLRELLLGVRVERARALLASGAALSYVAAEVGYSSEKALKNALRRPAPNSRRPGKEG